MILYVENPKDYTHTHTLLELKNKYSKVAGYKVNIQKLIIFLYINIDRSKKEIKKTIPFTVASKRIKYLGINLTKEVKGLCTEYYKTLMKEIDEDPNKWILMFMDWKN